MGKIPVSEKSGGILMPRPNNRLKVFYTIVVSGEPKSSSAIAELTGLPVREVARHLRVLRGMGMVSSIAGRRTATNPTMWRLNGVPSEGGNFIS